MGRPVVFFTKRKQSGIELAHALDGTFMEAHNAVDTVERLHRGEINVVVTTEGFAHGWRAPAGTLLVFLEDFSLAEREQAQARVPSRLHRSGS